MKTQVMICFFLLQAITVGCAQANQTDIDKKAQSQVETVAARLTNGEIRRVEILQIPPLVDTNIRITPDTLEKGFEYKLTISDIRAVYYYDGLIDALKTITVRRQSEIPDLRWGIIFYDVNDERSGAIYFDKWGRNGAVGDIPVSFEGNLFKWLNTNFSKCFR